MEKLASKLLKSVVIRFKKRQKRLLISKSSSAHFEFFLEKNIDTEFVVINTNIGLAIYYAASKDYSETIKQIVLQFCEQPTEELIFLYDANLETLKINFTKALYTFANYPQLFLAYVKKFAYLRKKHDTSKIVMPQLADLYEETIKDLYQQGKLPYAEKIMAIDGGFFSKSKDSLLASLAQKMTTGDHFN